MMIISYYTKLAMLKLISWLVQVAPRKPNRLVFLFLSQSHPKTSRVRSETCQETTLFIFIGPRYPWDPIYVYRTLSLVALRLN